MDILVPAAFVAVLLSIHAYFRWRAGHPASRVERMAAKLWTLIRRMVLFFAALACLGAAGALVLNQIKHGVDALSLTGFALAIAMAFLFGHWGRYGMGLRRYDSSDDKAVHEARRRRYD